MPRRKATTVTVDPRLLAGFLLLVVAALLVALLLFRSRAEEIVPSASPTLSPTPVPSIGDSAATAAGHAVSLGSLTISLDPWGRPADLIRRTPGATTLVYVHGTGNHPTTCTPIQPPESYALVFYKTSLGSSCTGGAECVRVSVSSVQCPAATAAETKFQFIVPLAAPPPNATAETWTAKTSLTDGDGSGATTTASEAVTVH